MITQSPINKYLICQEDIICNPSHNEYSFKNLIFGISIFEKLFCKIHTQYKPTVDCNFLSSSRDFFVTIPSPAPFFCIIFGKKQEGNNQCVDDCCSTCPKTGTENTIE